MPTKLSSPLPMCQEVFLKFQGPESARSNFAALPNLQDSQAFAALIRSSPKRSKRNWEEKCFLSTVFGIAAKQQNLMASPILSKKELKQSIPKRANRKPELKSIFTSLKPNA